MSAAEDRQLEKQRQLEEELTARLKAKRKAGRNGDMGSTSLGLNSMMDMMTIILVFLLKSYGEEPITILPNTDVPLSTSEILPKDMTVVTVNKEGIFLVRNRVLDLSEGKVPGNFKKGGESGLIIEPLEAQLRTEAEKLKSIAAQTGKEFEGDMTIIADQATNYRLLVEVMQTAIGAEFKRFRFAVIQGSREQSGRYSTAPELKR